MFQKWKSLAFHHTLLSSRYYFNSLKIILYHSNFEKEFYYLSMLDNGRKSK